MALPVNPAPKCPDCKVSYDEGVHRMTLTLKEGAYKCHYCAIAVLQQNRVTPVPNSGRIPVANIRNIIAQRQVAEKKNSKLIFPADQNIQRRWNLHTHQFEVFEKEHSKEEVPLLAPPFISPEAVLLQGDEALLAGKVDEALAHYQVAANIPETPETRSKALFMRARVYFDQAKDTILRGTPEQMPFLKNLAFFTLEAAAKEANSQAMLTLANWTLYEKGEEAGMELLVQAVNQGNPAAWVRFSEIHLTKAETTQDQQQRMLCMKLAYGFAKSVLHLEEGEAGKINQQDAFVALARCYAQEETPFSNAKLALQAYRNAYRETDILDVDDVNNFRRFLQRAFAQSGQQGNIDADLLARRLSPKELFAAMQFFLEKSDSFVNEQQRVSNLLSFADIHDKTALCYSRGWGVAQDATMALHHLYQALFALEKIPEGARHIGEIRVIYSRIITSIQVLRGALQLEEDESLPVLAPVENPA